MANADRGIISDILNAFIGAVFGGFMGVLISGTNDVRLALILFIMTIVSLCGAISLYLRSTIQGFCFTLSVWGFGIALSFFFHHSLIAVILAILTSTFCARAIWLALF